MLQVQCLARDGGVPSLTDTTIVYINVRRNIWPPTIHTFNRTVTVCEEQILGETFELVNAFDQDTTVSGSQLTNL